MPSVYLRQVNDNQSLEAETSRSCRPGSSKVIAPAIRESLDLIERAIPGLAGEVRALAPEIILVTSHGRDGYEFHGASSFHLWGVDPRQRRCPSNAPQAGGGDGARERPCTAHGAALGRPIVSNSADALYSFPCARPPSHGGHRCMRPTFCAHAFHHGPRCLASGELSADEEKNAADLQGRFRQLVRGRPGRRAGHAEFTDVGAQLFAAAPATWRTM